MGLYRVHDLGFSIRGSGPQLRIHPVSGLNLLAESK